MWLPILAIVCMLDADCSDAHCAEAKFVDYPHATDTEAQCEALAREWIVYAQPEQIGGRPQTFIAVSCVEVGD